MASPGSMPPTMGANLFLGAIVAIAAFCALYNLACLVPEQRALHRFQEDPSCHPVIGRDAAPGACQFELDTVVGAPRLVRVRGDRTWLLPVKTPAGAITTVHVYGDFNGQLQKGVHSIGRLTYGGQVVSIYAGSVIEPTSAFPSLADRWFNAVFSAFLAIVFAIPLALRVRQRVGFKPDRG